MEAPLDEMVSSHKDQSQNLNDEESVETPKRTNSDVWPVFRKTLSFKEYKGFSQIENIKSRYKIGRVLGKGSFGQVRLAIHRKTNIKCAIKMISKESLSK
jgi:hypothetical protein